MSQVLLENVGGVDESGKVQTGSGRRKACLFKKTEPNLRRRCTVRAEASPLSFSGRSRSAVCFNVCFRSPSVRRRRFGLSRKILGSASFGLLGSRRAVAVDYMPVLRHICRLQSAQEQKEPSR